MVKNSSPSHQELSRADYERIQRDNAAHGDRVAALERQMGELRRSSSSSGRGGGYRSSRIMMLVLILLVLLFGWLQVSNMRLLHSDSFSRPIHDTITDHPRGLFFTGPPRAGDNHARGNMRQTQPVDLDSRNVERRAAESEHSNAENTGLTWNVINKGDSEAQEVIDTDTQTEPISQDEEVNVDTANEEDTSKSEEEEKKSEIVQEEELPPGVVTDDIPRADPNFEPRILKKDKRPNILLLYADDWRHDTLGCAGNPVVKTPVFDKMAKEGIRFVQNMVTTSICWISRATLLTGQYMSSHKYQERSADFPRPWNETYIPMLQKAGYYVGHVGKWGISWLPHAPIDYNREYEGSHFIDDVWGDWPEGTPPIHVTEANGKQALDFLKNRPKEEDRPFYLSVHFFATHAEDSHDDQYLPQKRSKSLYKNVTIPVTDTSDVGGDKFYNKMPYFFDENNEGRTRWRWRFETPKKHQRMMKNYYRMATEVDTASGQIIEELKKQGVLDNTVIIFTTDNGNYHAEHGLADKWYPHQESIRVPLIIQDPRIPKKAQGRVNEDITLNIDLAPTILGAAGIEVPDFMQGRDMSELYSKDGDHLLPPWRTEFFYEHPLIFPTDFIPSSEALVRKDLKYFRWPDFNFTQLFDLRTDPGEIRDVINKTKYKRNVKEMKARYAELKAEAGSKYRYYDYFKHPVSGESQESDESEEGDESDESEEEHQSDTAEEASKQDEADNSKEAESSTEEDGKSDKTEDGDKSDESEEEHQSDTAGEASKHDEADNSKEAESSTEEDGKSDKSEDGDKSDESEEEHQSDTSGEASKQDKADNSKEAESSTEEDGKSERTAAFTFSRGEEVTKTR